MYVDFLVRVKSERASGAPSASGAGRHRRAGRRVGDRRVNDRRVGGLGRVGEWFRTVRFWAYKKSPFSWACRNTICPLGTIPTYFLLIIMGMYMYFGGKR